MLGIFGIRVQPPACVLVGISGKFGIGSTGFKEVDNACNCDMCEAVRNGLLDTNEVRTLTKTKPK